MKNNWTNIKYTDMKNVVRTGYLCTRIIDEDADYGLSSETKIGSIIPSISLHISNEGDGMRYCATRRMDDTIRNTHNTYFKKLSEAMIWIEEYEEQES